MDENNNNQPESQESQNKFAKALKNNMRTIIVTAAVFVVTFIIMFCFVYPGGIFKKTLFEKNAAQLGKYIFSDKNLRTVIDGELGETGSYTVFISISDGKTRADVVSATDSTPQKAYKTAVKSAKEAADKKNRGITFIKADIVNTKQTVKQIDLTGRVMQAGEKYFFRYGISFDKEFKTAFLEQEINANDLIDYEETLDIDENRVERYLSACNRAGDAVPDEEIILFTCRGYIYDNGELFTLRHEPDEYYGRRIADTLDKGFIKDVIADASKYLTSLQKETGKFIYGYKPTTGGVITSYNILRHAGTTWSLATAYNLTRDESLREPIDKAIKYLVSQVMYKDENTAYVIEEKSNEIKLGANGIALLCILDYMKITGNNEYEELAVKIANGILLLQNPDTGGYVHVLYVNEPGHEDYSVKEEYSVSFYDGEATLGLIKMYNRTSEQKWLDAAKRGMDFFIANDYTRFRDHWLSYSANELTKIVPEQKYFEFGLKNVQVNLPLMKDKLVTSHVDVELMINAFIMYDRIKTEGIQVDFMEQFDEKEYIKTLVNRLDYNLNAFAEPELAMYFEYPRTVLNAFLIRSDAFRSRIDDTQHYIGGYCLYVDYADRIMEYYKNFA